MDFDFNLSTHNGNALTCSVMSVMYLARVASTFTYLERNICPRATKARLKLSQNV